MAYNPEKNLTLLFVGEEDSITRGLEKKNIFFAQTKSPIPAPPQKSNGQPLNRPLPEIFHI